MAIQVTINTRNYFYKKKPKLNLGIKLQQLTWSSQLLQSCMLRRKMINRKHCRFSSFLQSFVEDKNDTIIQSPKRLDRYWFKARYIKWYCKKDFMVINFNVFQFCTLSNLPITALLYKIFASLPLGIKVWCSVVGVYKNQQKITSYMDVHKFLKLNTYPKISLSPKI